MRGFRWNLERPTVATTLLSFVLLTACLVFGGVPALAGGLEGGAGGPEDDGRGSGPVAGRSLEELAREEFERSLANDPWPDGSQLRGPGGADVLAGFGCIPSCDVADARFLALANGAANVTLSEPDLDVQIAVPSTTVSFTVGIFDGDADVANGNWDIGTAPFSYTLFEDPDRDATGTTVAAGPFLSSALINNGW